jgi:hypothetical protein
MIAFDEKLSLKDWFLQNLTRLFLILGAEGIIRGKITQTGTANPSATTPTVNTIAAFTATTLVWERTGVGLYRAPLPSAINITKLDFPAQQWHSNDGTTAKFIYLSAATDTGVKYLYLNNYAFTLATGATALADVLTAAPFEIRLNS